MTERLDKLALALGQRLRAAGLMLATAESCTGGWVAKVVTDIPGSSGWFDHGFVTYDNRAKQEMRGFRRRHRRPWRGQRGGGPGDGPGGVLEHSWADVAFAITGIAGPTGGTENKPVGTVYFAWVRASRRPRTRHVWFAGNREAVRRQSVRLALEHLPERLESGD